MMFGSSSSLLTIVQNAVLAINGLAQQFQKFFKTKIIISITDFGGVGDGKTDNLAAYLRAVAFLSGTGGSIFFPPGTYLFSANAPFNYPTGTFSVSIVGSGADSTVLFWPNASGGLTFTLSGIGSSIHVRDLTLTTGATNGGNALLIQSSFADANPALTAISDIYRVTIRGSDAYPVFANYWTIGVNLTNVSNIQIENLTALGPATPNGTGITLIGNPGGATYGVVYNIAKSTFNNLTGIQYGSYIQGVTVDQCNFTSNNGTCNGIFGPGGQTGQLLQLNVTNCQFNVPTNAIVLGTVVGDVLIANNLVISRANSNAFNLGPVTFFTITGNLLAGNTTALLNSSNAVSNYIANNPGYNPVGVTTNTMGTSPFTYAAGSSPETHYVRSAGTISSITIGGQTIATAALANDPITIQLGPNESYITTWATTAPTYVRSVH